MRTPPARTPFRSGNPTLNERVFAGGVTATGDTMTVQGTINKTARYMEWYAAFGLLVTLVWLYLELLRLLAKLRGR